MEPDLQAHLTRFYAQGDRKVGFADADRTIEHQILLFLDEPATDQFFLRERRRQPDTAKLVTFQAF